jgi:hypothetical protein
MHTSVDLGTLANMFLSLRYINRHQVSNVHSVDTRLQVFFFYSDLPDDATPVGFQSTLIRDRFQS